MKKVVWVKFGWSEFYRGGEVDGNFSWLIDHKKSADGKRGHEAFNFNPAPDGEYYCYVPPQGGLHAPWNDDPHGWTVICLAKNPKHTGIHVVGWYENATLLGDWLEPPYGRLPKRGDSSHPAYDWSYCIKSPIAYFIPPDERTLPFSDNSIKQGKYSFLAGPNVKVTENKRRVLHLLESRIKRLSRVAIKNPDNDKLPDPELDASDPLGNFGTPEHRKEVELAAEKFVINFYAEKGYSCRRVTHLPCGHDFEFEKGRSTIHVEVKGTSGLSPKFFLMRNEYAKGFLGNPAWRLAMVTSALSTNPTLLEYSAAELHRAFDLEPYVFIAKLIPLAVTESES